MATRAEQAMAAVAEKDAPETRSELYASLMEGELLVLAEGRLAGAGESRESLPVVAVQNDDEGYACAMVFTSEQALRAYQPEEAAWARLKGLSLFGMLADMRVERVYINGGSSIWGLLGSSEIQSLAKGETPQAGQVETYNLPDLSEVRISAPEHEMHPEVRQALKAAVEHEGRIGFAYLPRMSHPHSPQPQPVLVVVPAHGVSDEMIGQAVDELGEKIQTIMGEDRFLDVMTLPPHHELLRPVMQTGCVLAVNDDQLHDVCLERYVKPQSQLLLPRPEQ